VMFSVATDKLCGLSKLCLHIAQRKMLKATAAIELFLCRLHGGAKTTASNLHIDAIGAVVCPHQSRHPDNRFVPE
jgi:hypothetical protein